MAFGEKINQQEASLVRGGADQKDDEESTQKIENHNIKKRKKYLSNTFICQ